MSVPCPFSYALGGVRNTRVTVADSDASLEVLYKQFQKPIAVAEDVDAYHAAPPKHRSDLKKDLPYFVGGTLQPPRRDDANIKARTLLTLDIEASSKQDAQPPQPQAVSARLKELGGSGWVYTSIGHTREKPRYRVVLPLGAPIADADVAVMASQLQASTVQAAARLGLKDWCQPESWVLSQPMYVPARLQGAPFFSMLTKGKAWAVRQPKATTSQPADIPDERPDWVLVALRAAGLYINEDPQHAGKHFIRCPFQDQHDAVNDTQTVYYEAHFDGNPRPAVKCFDTAPDEDGVPHLSFAKLVRWLREKGHLDKSKDDTGVLDDYETFLRKARIGPMLDTEPEEREFALDLFAPIGKVTVLAGPGGVSKSMLMLHAMVHGACGQQWGCFQVAQPLKSLYVSYEDDRQELHKRTRTLADSLQAQDDGAFALLHDVHGGMRQNLLMYAADEEAPQWLLMSKPDRYSPAERTERVDWLVGFITAHSIRMLCIDPVVYAHTLEESDNGEMALFMQTLTLIAKQAQCAVVVLHHMNKMSSVLSLDEVTQASLRGASSFADNARSVAVLTSMPVKDAPAYGLPAEHATSERYVVFKHVKHNYSRGLGQLVFERSGGTLLPRPDIVKLSQQEAEDARQEVKSQTEERRVQAHALKLLAFLLKHKDWSSTTQATLGSKLHARLLKPVVTYCEEQDWLETMPEGRTNLLRITKEGKGWLSLHK